MASGPEILAQEIQVTRTLTHKPFEVNLITLHPRLEELIQVCIQERVSHVVLAGGLPQGSSISTLKNAGIKVICFAPGLIIGRKLIRMGGGCLGT